MGINLKEKFKNINKKIVVIVGIIIIAIIAGSIYGFEYAKSQQIKKQQMIALQNQNPQTRFSKKPSDYKIGIPYEKAMKENKPVVVLFYADWCHYCIGFMPIYQKLSEIYKKDYNFTKINVEDPKYIKVVRNTGIAGFPTVYLIDPKHDNKVLLSNSIFGDMDKFKAEMDRFLRIRKLLDKKH